MIHTATVLTFLKDYPISVTDLLIYKGAQYKVRWTLYPRLLWPRCVVQLCLITYPLATAVPYLECAQGAGRDMIQSPKVVSSTRVGGPGCLRLTGVVRHLGASLYISGLSG